MDPLNKPQTADQEGAKISPHWGKVADGGESHWDMMWRLYGEAWFVGNITKYTLRYKHKNGMQDLLKARNYLNKLIELEQKAAHEEGVRNQLVHWWTGASDHAICGTIVKGRPVMHTIDPSAVTCPVCLAELQKPVEDILKQRD
jgi:hypothetical protein